MLFIEAKHCKRDARVELFKKTKPLALDEDKIPLLAISQHGEPGFFIFCHSSDLLAIANQRAKVLRNGG